MEANQQLLGQWICFRNFLLENNAYGQLAKPLQYYPWRCMDNDDKLWTGFGDSKGVKVNPRQIAKGKTKGSYTDYQT